MNTLFPIFIKLDLFSTLVVGGGHVGTEKVTAILNNTPLANVTVVAPFISEKIQFLAEKHPTLSLYFEPYHVRFLEKRQFVVVGTSNPEVQSQVYLDAKEKGVFINVADNPAKCDFYLSSVVHKGDLKIAISTNGKSPTLSIRLREIFDSVIPQESIQEILDNLNLIRQALKNYSFEQKTEYLKRVTRFFSLTK